MSFKRSLLFVISVLTINLGCSEYLRGNKKTDDVLQVESHEAQCLKDVPAKFLRYFDDDIGTVELDETFGCIQRTLKTFVKYTKGASPDRYTPQELQHFLNRYLLVENKLSDGFVAELMKVKVFVVGGSFSHFTRGEMDQLSTYLETVRRQANLLLGSMSLFLFRADPKHVTELQIQDVQNKLVTAMQGLIFGGKITLSSYSLSDLQALVTHFGEFTGSDNVTGTLRWFPIAAATKSLFLGDKIHLQSELEWRQDIDWISRAYGLALRYHFLGHDLDAQNPKLWTLMLQLTDEAFELAEKAPSFVENEVFSAKNIDGLIDQLYAMKLLNISMSKEIVKDTYKKILFYWIDQKTDDTVNIRGLEKRHLAALRFEYEVWRKGQLMLTSAFARHDELSNKELRNFADTHSMEFERIYKDLSVGAREARISAWLEWLKTFDKERVPILDRKYKIVVAYDANAEKQNFVGLTASNAIRMVVRLWMRGYGEESSNDDFFRHVMTLKRLSDLELNFRDFGRAVGFLDPRSTNAASRTFKEGNFFTYSGNGDDKLDGQELYELLHFMVSGGLVINAEMKKEAELEGCQVSELDIKAKPKLKVSCVRQMMKDKFDLFFPKLPSMKAFVKEMIRTNQFDAYFDLMMTLAREKNFTPELTENSEIRVLACLTQYVESLFVQFDLDRSQGLSKAEIFTAEPRFHGFILNFRPGISNGLVPEIFLYLLSQGKVPDLRTDQWQHFKRDIGDWFAYLKDRALMDTRWNSIPEANRLHLLRVLGVLKNNE